MSGRVLILTLDPVHIGGVQTMCRAVLRAHAALGLRSVVASLRSDRVGRWDPRLRWGSTAGEPDDPETVTAGYWPTIEYLNYALAALLLRPRLREFDAIHVVSSFHSPSLVPILGGRPFVSWVATPFVDEIESRWQGTVPTASVRVNHALRRANQTLERWSYRHPRAVWALSTYTGRRLVELGLRAETVEVQNAPVDTEVFRPSASGASVEPWGSVENGLLRPQAQVAGPRGRGSRYVLSVGRLDDARKNYPALLTAFARDLAPGFDDVDLVLAGPGAENSGLPALARELGVATRVIFPGALAETELAAAYRGAAAFALGSRQEGLGLVVLEAQACGAPCIAMRCGGVEDLIVDGRTGLLVDQGDQAGLAAGLGRLLTERAWAAELGRAARDHVLRTSSLAAFARRLREIYGRAFPGLVVAPPTAD